MNDDRNDRRATPAELLDRRARALAARHERALQRMTVDALARARPPRRRAGAWLAVPAAALGMALMAAVVVWRGGERSAAPPLAQAPDDALPAWVLDDSAPVSLLENLDFYVWLAEQGDDGQG